MQFAAALISNSRALLADCGKHPQFAMSLGTPSPFSRCLNRIERGCRQNDSLDVKLENDVREKELRQESRCFQDVFFKFPIAADS